MTLFPAVLQGLRDHGMGDVLVFGGGIIPAADVTGCSTWGWQRSSPRGHRCRTSRAGCGSSAGRTPPDPLRYSLPGKLRHMEHVLGDRWILLRGRRPRGPERLVSGLPWPRSRRDGLWRQGARPTVFATFESETDYFGSRSQQVMLNFRVRDLDAMLAQLRAKGADVADETQDMEGVGRFGWVTDPEGNRVELWQPA